jgi:menaquinone-9 beta-reductase
MPDVTIIGGGPAGSTAAVLLARAGWDVTLVEQSRFPRDKVCGECLSALGFEVLTHLGLVDAFHAAGAVPLERAGLHSSGGKCLTLDLPSPMWGLSRRALDTLLLDAARAAGAAVRQSVRCEAVDARAGAPIALRLRDLATNETIDSSPGRLILADGKASFAHDAPPHTNDFGVKAHFTDVDGPRDAIELFGVRGSYGGLAAIEGGRWNAAFSVPASRLKQHRGDIEALFAELMCENKTLAARCRRATRAGPWLAAPLPRFGVRSSCDPRVIPVGNAAAAIEPIGGEGMGLAMRSAELTADALIRAVEGRRAMRALWRTRGLACRGAALAAASPTISGVLARLRVPTSGKSLALSVIGK